MTALALIKLGVKSHLSFFSAISSSNYSLVKEASYPKMSINTPDMSTSFSSSLSFMKVITLFIVSLSSVYYISISGHIVYVSFHFKASVWDQMVENLIKFLKRSGNSLSLQLIDCEA